MGGLGVNLTGALASKVAALGNKLHVGTVSVADSAANVAAALVLIDRGAAVLARNDRGETPIDLAIRYGHEAVSALLTGLLAPGPSVAGYAAASV